MKARTRWGTGLHRWLRPAVIAGVLLAVHLPQPPAAQVVTAPALEAAFIFNFVKFTEWPARPAPEPFVLCVMGGPAVGSALEQIVRGRQVAGRPMVTLAATKPTRTCAVLYVPGGTLEEAAQAIAGLEGAPVLTVSDIAGFNDIGGMVQLLFERGALRFTINVEAVKRSGLTMSSRLLALGKR